MSPAALISRIYFPRGWRLWVGCAILVNSICVGAITETPEGSTLAVGLGAPTRRCHAARFDVALCIAGKRARSPIAAGTFSTSRDPRLDRAHVGFLSAFRVLRVVSVLRLVSFAPRGRDRGRVLLALRDMTAAFLVLTVVFYSFVVIATNMFRDIDPAHTGGLARSAAHLYAVMVSLGSNLRPRPCSRPYPGRCPVRRLHHRGEFRAPQHVHRGLVAALKEELDRKTRARSAPASTARSARSKSSTAEIGRDEITDAKLAQNGSFTLRRPPSRGIAASNET